MKPRGLLPHSWARSIQSMPFPPSHFPKIHFNIIFHRHLVLSSGHLPSGFSTKILYAPLLSPICATWLADLSSRFDHPNNIWWGVQSIKLLLMQSSPLPRHLIPLGVKYPPQHSILENFSLRSSLNVRHQASQPYKTAGKIIIPSVEPEILFPCSQ